MFQWAFSTHKEHSVQWYIVAIIVVLTLVIYGITQQLYIMSVVALLFAGVYIFMENNTDSITPVIIDSQTIIIGKTPYELKGIEKFAIISINSVPTYLRILPKKRLSVKIDIPLTTEVDTNALRSHLLQYIEEDMNESFTNSDALIHMMKL